MAEDTVATLKEAAMKELASSIALLSVDIRIFEEEGVGLGLLRTRAAEVLCAVGKVEVLCCLDCV